jgi:hypothetical protein
MSGVLSVRAGRPRKRSGLGNANRARRWGPRPANGVRSRLLREGQGPAALPASSGARKRVNRSVVSAT